MPYYKRNLYVLYLTTFLAAASWNQVLPFLPLFLKELGVREGLEEWSGIVFAANFLASIVMMPLWGKLADSVGRKAMTVRAGFCLAAIYFLMSLTTQAWHVAVLRFLNGALTGFIPSSMTLVATNTPKQLASRYVAALQTAAAAGSIVGPALGGLLAQLFGYRGAMQASGALVLFSVLLVLFLVEERNKVQLKARTSLWQDFQTAFHMPVLRTVMVSMILAFGAISAVQPFLTLYLEEIDPGAPPWVGGLIFSLPGIAFVLTAGAWTRLGERIGHQRLIPGALVATALLFAGLFLPQGLWLFGAVFFGASVFNAALRPTAAALIADRVPEEFQGRAYGMQQSALTFGGLVFPLAAGAVGGALGHRVVFPIIALLLLVGTAFLTHQIQTWDASVSYRDLSRRLLRRAGHP